MDMDMLILGLLGLNLVLLGMLWIKVSSLNQDRANEKQAEMLKEDFNRQMAANRMEINQMVNGQFKTVFETLRATSKDQTDNLKDFGLLFRENVREFNELQREKFSELILRQERMLQSTEERLDKMRETVDEKLQKTLESRIGKSFEADMS